MLNNIENQDILLKNSIAQQNQVSTIGSKAEAKNPYMKLAEFGDKLDISEEARKLYEQEQDIAKYKSMVMAALNAPENKEETASILDLIKSGEYVSDDDLADTMIEEGPGSVDASELLDILFNSED